MGRLKLCCSLITHLAVCFVLSLVPLTTANEASKIEMIVHSIIPGSDYESDNYPLRNAVDGNFKTPGVYWNNETIQGWIEFQFYEVYRIESVLLYPYHDNNYKLQNIDILVGHDTYVQRCTSILSQVPVGGKRYTCDKPIEGHTVALMKRTPGDRGEVLNELQIFGWTVGRTLFPPNLAGGCPVKTSQVDPMFSKTSTAVDNFVNEQKLKLKSGTNMQWIIIDFRMPVPVDRIVFFLMYECCTDNNVGEMIVSVLMEDPKTLEGFPDKVELQVNHICIHLSGDEISSVFFNRFKNIYNCEKQIDGRYLWLMLKSTDPSKLLKTLSVLEVIVLPPLEINDMGIAAGRKNLALGKPTSQSSTRRNRYASLVVDGYLNMTGSDFLKCSATNTKFSDPWAWWMVDLQGIYAIVAVRIYSSLLQDLFNIEVVAVSDDLQTIEICTKIVVAILLRGITYECDRPVKGRYVKIRYIKKDKNALYLCEVQVFGTMLDEAIIQRQNYALMKPIKHSAVSSSSYRGETAVDGVYYNNTSFELFCVNIAGGILTQWIIVDLKNVFPVGIVTVAMSYQYSFNREPPTDKFTLAVTVDDPQNLENFPAIVDPSTVCKHVVDHKFNRFPTSVICDKPLAGRYVWLVIKSSKPKYTLRTLTVCEIEVGPPPIVNNNMNDDKGLLWTFKLIKQKGSQAMINDPQSQRHMTQCARSRIRDKKSILAARYIQVDLPNGGCRFLSGLDASDEIDSSHWVVYELI